MSDIALDRVLILEAVRVTEAAAVAAWRLTGRGDEIAADQAAATAMRTALEKMPIQGVVVIGEGDRDEASALYVGEKVGTGKGPRVDIAVDALEGATLTAKALPNALAVMALAPSGTLLNAPDTYMDKLAIGPGYPPGVVDLDASPAQNIRALAAAKNVDPREITACVLDRPRHAEILASLREIGCRVNLIGDGDVAGVINTADPETGIDIYLGQGGAPEGVLACVALKCAGGQFQGRLQFRSPDERARAQRLGITDLDRKYSLNDIVRGNAIFVATGVTNGALLDGVRFSRGVVHTHSVAMNTTTGSVREIRLKRPVDA